MTTPRNTQSVAITSLPTSNLVLQTDVYPGVDTTDPTESVAGTTKQYTMSELTAGLLSQRVSCHLATTSNLVCTYVNGTNNNGIGATLTFNSTGAQSIDGVALTLNTRVLVKNQSTSSQNGIYYVSTLPATGIFGVLTRSLDYDNNASGLVTEGTYTLITEGSTNAGSIWYLSTTGTIVLGTTGLNFFTLAGSGGGGVSNIGTAGLATGGPITSTGTIAVTGAVELDQETATSSSTVVTPSVQQYHPSAVKARGSVSVNAGVYTLVDGYNVTSISHLGTGEPQIIFTVPFANANYTVIGNVLNGGNGGFWDLSSRSTTNFVAITKDPSGNNTDLPFFFEVTGTST